MTLEDQARAALLAHYSRAGLSGDELTARVEKTLAHQLKPLHKSPDNTGSYRFRAETRQQLREVWALRDQAEQHFEDAKEDFEDAKRRLEKAKTQVARASALVKSTESRLQETQTYVLEMTINGEPCDMFLMEDDSWVAPLVDGVREFDSVEAATAYAPKALECFNSIQRSDFARLDEIRIVSLVAVAA